MHFKGRQKLTPEQLLDPPASARGWFSWLDQSEFPNTTKTWRKIRIWDKQVQKKGDEVHRNPYSHRWWTRGCFFFVCLMLLSFFFCNFLSRWSFALRLSNFQTSPSGRSLFLPPRVRGGSQFLYVALGQHYFRILTLEDLPRKPLHRTCISGSALARLLISSGSVGCSENDL